MANENLIDPNEFWDRLNKASYDVITYPDREMDSPQFGYYTDTIQAVLNQTKKVDAVVHGQRMYNAHEVSEIIAELFGDTCACNFNSIDEWLPFKCELQDACPSPVGVACWEQYLKYRDSKMDGDGNGK